MAGCVCARKCGSGDLPVTSRAAGTRPLPVSLQAGFHDGLFLGHESGMQGPEWAGQAPLSLACQHIWSLCPAPGETELGHSWGRSVSGAVWRKEGLLRLGGTPASNNANTTLV